MKQFDPLYESHAYRATKFDADWLAYLCGSDLTEEQLEQLERQRGIREMRKVINIVVRSLAA